MRKIFAFLIVLSTQANQSAVELDTIHVTHEYDALNIIEEDDSTIEVIGLEELENHQVNNMDDILRLTPGATTAGGPRSSGEAIQVRGLDANKVYLYIDGARQNFSTDHSTMVAIDPEDIKAVKINKSSSSLSHSGSLGGGIELQTKGARDYLKGRNKVGSQIKSSFQDANDEKMFNVKAYAVENNSDYLLSMTSRDALNTKGYEDRVLENSVYKDTAGLFKYNFQKANNQLSFTYNYFLRKDTAPMNPTLDPPLSITDLNSENEVERNMGVLNHVYKSSKYERELRSTISYTTQGLEKERKSDKRLEDRNIKTVGVKVADHFLPVKKVKVTHGHEFNQDSLEGSSNNDKLSSYPNGKSSIISNYIDLSFSATSKFELLTGLKTYFYQLKSSNKELSERDDSFLKKKIGFNFKPFDNLNFSAVYSEGLNTPKIQEIYLDGFHFEGDDFYMADNFFIPNLNLMPEESETLELSASYAKSFLDYDYFKFQMSHYWTKAHNYITLSQTTGDPWEDIVGTTQAINIPESRLRGSEFSIDYTYDFLNYKFSYSRIRGDNISEGIYLQRLPADTYSHQLTFYLDNYGVSFGYQGLNTLKQDRVNSGTTQREDETPGYFIHNLFISKVFRKGALKGLSINTKVENLTNRYYRKHASNIDELGIDYKLGLSYKVTTF